MKTTLLRILPWISSAVLLVMLIWPAQPALPPSGQEQTASAACTGLLNISSCNVRAEAHQQPAQTEKADKPNLTEALLLIVIVGGATFVLGALISHDSAYRDIEQALGGGR